MLDATSTTELTGARYWWLQGQERQARQARWSDARAQRFEQFWR